MTSGPVLAVVGGGIAGLAAALEARAARPDAQVVVLEASPQVGGKLRSGEVGGIEVDVGADSMLARVPDGVQLARDAGLGDDLVAPATSSAGLWVDSRLRRLPAGTVMGIPADLAALARSEVLSGVGLNRVPLDLVLPGPPVRDDVAVGALVRRRLGRQVVDRLVDPLLGGVYAGRADLLSLQATLPQLVGPVSRSRSLILAARSVRAAAGSGGGGLGSSGGGPAASAGGPASSAGAAVASAGGPAAAPVFAGLRGGLGRLPAAVAAASGAQVRTGTTVRGLARTPSGWRLTLGSAAAPEPLDADAVVLAVPAAPASRLLREVVPAAAADVGALEYASVGLVTLVLDGPAPGRGSGYLVPVTEARATKAVTFASRKWAYYPGRPSVVRASVGRFGEQVHLQRPDRELVDLVRSELALALGPLPRVLDSRVTRWGGGLPQYAVGHLQRVRRARAAVAAQPGLALAGAAYDGVGVPACARSGREAAREALATLAQNGRHDRDQA